MDRLGSRRRRITLGADTGDDVLGFVHVLRQCRVTPHVAIDRRVSKLGVARRSSVDGRTTRHPRYAVSQRVRKRIEEVFGWVRSSAKFRQSRHRGRERVGWCFDFAATAYQPDPTGLAGVVVSGVTAWLFMKGRRGDLNIRAAFVHMAADASLTLAVAIAVNCGRTM